MSLKTAFSLTSPSVAVSYADDKYKETGKDYDKESLASEEDDENLAYKLYKIIKGSLKKIFGLFGAFGDNDKESEYVYPESEKESKKNSSLKGTIDEMQQVVSSAEN